MKTSVSDCLKYLELAGWSELIDARWRRQIEKELRECFEDKLSEETLQQVLDIVLTGDRDLPEGEYKYLLPIPERVSKKLMEKSPLIANH